MSRPVLSLLLPATWWPDTAASARALAGLYTVVLIATTVLLGALLTMVVMRRAPAGTRALVLRWTVAVLAAVYVGRALPLERFTSVLPPSLAAPLVALGRLEVSHGDTLARLTGGDRVSDWQETGRGRWRETSAALGAGGVDRDLAAGARGVKRRLTAGTPDTRFVDMVRASLIVYWAGVAVVLLRLLGAWRGIAVVARRGRPVADPASRGLLDQCRRAAGLTSDVTMWLCDAVRVPLAVGWRPAILLPSDWEGWSRPQQRAVLLHELAHVRRRDVPFTIVTQLVCALYWFHPAVWRLARALRHHTEEACDDRVLANGVRSSDYAELLMRVAASCGRQARPSLAPSLSARWGLRRRLVAVLDADRDRRAPGRRAHVLATALSLVVVVVASTARLAPSREVLTALMRDSRWESRAYAVIGLAQRADSVDVARAASR
ncbi:MAG TPA: M56 family metallopeptidase, partial [Gemmatimonadaceae bacterium]